MMYARKWQLVREDVDAEYGDEEQVLRIRPRRSINKRI